MGYRIKPVSRKKGPQWKLQFISYKKADATNPEATQPEKIKDIPKQDWDQHGFSLDMTIDMAKSKAKSLNAQHEIKRWGETKAKIRERLEKEDTIECAFLPDLFVNEFEVDILFEKICRNSENVRTKNKVDSHWRAAKRIIREMKVDHSEWSDKAHKFYNYFVRQQWSLSYCSKLLRVLNEWGFFMSKKTKVAFFPIPFPPVAEQQRIQDSFFDKSPTGDGQASDPLTPQLLISQKNNLLEDNFNWLFISVWFGLRPHEINNLKDPKTWKKSINKNGRVLLHVYQPKLIKIPKAKRWKVIPLKFKEQTRAMELIESGNFRQPIYKVMRNWFGEGITPYGGRKGFTDLMLEKGQKFEEISMWMGHTTLDRTYRDYKDRLKTSYEDAS